MNELQLIEGCRKGRDELKKSFMMRIPENDGVCLRYVNDREGS